MESSIAEDAVLGIGLVAVGSALGAGAGSFVVRNQQDSIEKTFFPIETGVVGALATGFIGLLVSAVSPKYRRLGEAVAIVGVGAPVLLSLIGAVKSASAITTSGPSVT